jgi:hypothetical protein
MKRLFLFLLRKYIKTESQRMEIYQELWYQTKSEHNEATAFENVYNVNVEVLMSNPFFVNRVKIGDDKGLQKLKEWLDNSFEDGVYLTLKK